MEEKSLNAKSTNCPDQFVDLRLTELIRGDITAPNMKSAYFTTMTMTTTSRKPRGVASFG